MRDSFNPDQWGRLKRYCMNYTAGELSKMHGGYLAQALGNVADGCAPETTRPKAKLSSLAVGMALRYCKRSPAPNATGTVPEEIQE